MGNTLINTNQILLDNVGITNTLSVGDVPIANRTLNVNSSFDGSADQFGIISNAYITPPANEANAAYGMYFQSIKLGAFDHQRLIGGAGIVALNGSGTVASAYAYYGGIAFYGAAHAGVYTAAYVFAASAPYREAGNTGTIGQIAGLFIANQGAAYVTNAYGILIDSQSGSVNPAYAIYTSAGLVRFGGIVGIGGDPQTNTQLTIWGTFDGSAYQYGLTSSAYVNPPSNSAQATIGVAFQVIKQGTHDLGQTIGCTGTVGLDGTGTITTAHGFYVGMNFYGAAHGGTITTGNGLTVAAPYLDGGNTGAITTLRGLYVANQGAAYVTNAYGLYIDAISGAITNNYSIYTNAGDVFFNNLGSKIGFFGASPVVQPTAVTSLSLALSNLGLRAAGRAPAVTSSFGCAYGCYDYATDQHTAGTFAIAITTAIPANAVIVGGAIHVITQCAAGVGGTLAFGTSAGSSSTSLLAAAVYTTLVTDYIKTIVPTFAAPLRMTAGGNINCTIGTATFTAGKVEIWLFYYITGG